MCNCPWPMHGLETGEQSGKLTWNQAASPSIHDFVLLSMKLVSLHLNLKTKYGNLNLNIIFGESSMISLEKKSQVGKYCVNNLEVCSIEKSINRWIRDIELLKGRIHCSYNWYWRDNLLHKKIKYRIFFAFHLSLLYHRGRNIDHIVNWAAHRKQLEYALMCGLHFL